MNETSFERLQRYILQILRAFEDVQQDIRFNDVPAAQTGFAAAVGDALSEVASELDAAEGLDEDQRVALDRAASDLRGAYATFMTRRTWPDFALAYLASREQQCRALGLLYDLRDALPIVESYFRQDGAVPPTPDPGRSEDAQPTGIVHVDAGGAHNEYALYVPEYYDSNTEWPLVVCLHGSHGRAAEYLWTWLRPARSRGYLVLSAKSFGPTWSIMQPALDAESILSMLDAVTARYRIARSRILLTGLSDGGTFSYLVGLMNPERFTALAPIAGVLSPAADPLLRAGQGRQLQMHVVHGAHDPIFAVQTVRSTCDLLTSLGYALTYTELPDWGHALTHRINETIVLPWFEARD